MFVDTGVPSPPARSDVFAAQPQAVDLRCCFPLGASWSKLVPSDPSALKLIGPTRIAPAISTLPTSGSRLGTTTVGVRTADIRILPRDRERHIYCVGSTGVGKSTMLSGLILEDIRAGDGVCVIDPHGELSRQVLDRIPTARRRDVFWLKPGHEGRTFGLNLLQCDAGTSGVSAAVLANELLRVFGRLYDMRVAGGPVFEQYMRGAALLVMENRRPRGTVLDVVRVFESDSFRRGLLKTCINPVVVEFWTKTAHHASHELSLTAVAPYIVSKLNAFVSNLSVRTIIGQRRSTIDFGEAMANRAIVLLDLSVGSLGVADTQLLGMLVLSRLFAAALGRVAEGRSEAPPMRVYVDEAQVFATETLAEAMAQSRKGGLSFTLANQNLAQLKNATDGSRLLENIVSNASTFLAFRVGPFDSEILAPLFAPTLVRADLERLPDHHVACRLLVEGVPLEPFVCSTLALPLPDSPGDAREEIVARMPLYTRPMSEVEAEIALERTPTREE